MSQAADCFSSDRDRLEQKAAEWIALRYAGLDERQSAEFHRWLAADDRHAAIFAELDETWQLLDQVRDAPLAKTASSTPDADLLAPHHRKTAPVQKRWFFPAALAAAAALAFAYFGGAIAFGSKAKLDFTEQVVTEVGHWQNLDLPDGSRMRLNTDSRVEVAYSAQERRVRLLRGEAHFTVTKNPARPFFVEAGGVAVRAVGTAFNVRLNAQAIEVLVTEGKVRVDDVVRGKSVLATQEPAETPLLIAGQKAVIPALQVAEKRLPVPVAVVEPVEIERTLAWQDRRLEFVAAPLREIVGEFNRYNRHQLVIADAALAERRFGGSFRTDDPEAFVRLLQSRFGVNYERRTHETILRAPAPGL